MSQDVKQYWQISQKKNSDETDVLIYSVIGESMWDEDTVTAKKFVKDIRAINSKQINVRINSPGGSVFDGYAIHEALRNHKANVTAYVDGAALSIASVIAMAADKIIMAPNSMMMIHQPSGMAMGTADEMRTYADVLDKMFDMCVDTYAKRTKGDAKTIAKQVRDETWFTPKEAVDAGFADEIADSPVTEAVACADRWSPMWEQAGEKPNWAAIMETGFRITNADKDRPVVPAEPTNQEEDSIMDIKAMAVALGLPEEATEEQVLARAAELKQAAEQDPPDPKTGDGDDEDDDNDEGAGSDGGDPKEAGSTHVPEGATLVDAEQFKQLQADAAAGRDARDAQIAAQQSALIEKAVQEGRIPEARRDYWTSQLKHDPAGIPAVLQSFPAGSAVPVGQPVGHESPTSQGDDAYPAEWFPEIAQENTGSATIVRGGTIITKGV